MVYNSLDLGSKKGTEIGPLEVTWENVEYLDVSSSWFVEWSVFVDLCIPATYGCWVALEHSSPSTIFHEVLRSKFLTIGQTKRPEF